MKWDKVGLEMIFNFLIYFSVFCKFSLTNMDYFETRVRKRNQKELYINQYSRVRLHLNLGIWLGFRNPGRC